MPLFATAIVAEALSLLALTAFGDFSIHGNAMRFVTIFLAAAGAYLLATQLFRTVSQARWPVVFWSIAIILHLAVLPMHPADDFWRYIWEGKIQTHGFNPYLVNPESATLAPFRDEIWNKINH